MNATLTICPRVAINIGVDADEADFGDFDPVSSLTSRRQAGATVSRISRSHLARHAFPCRVVPAVNQQNAAQRIEDDTVVASAGVRGRSYLLLKLRALCSITLAVKRTVSRYETGKQLSMPTSMYVKRDLIGVGGGPAIVSPSLMTARERDSPDYFDLLEREATFWHSL
jgi:hypothetical protein